MISQIIKKKKKMQSKLNNLLVITITIPPQNGVVLKDQAQLLKH